jgi:hypothetical protein
MKRFLITTSLAFTVLSAPCAYSWGPIDGFSDPSRTQERMEQQRDRQERQWESMRRQHDEQNQQLLDMQRDQRQQSQLDSIQRELRHQRWGW